MTLLTSDGKHVEAEVEREVVMSEARRRKEAVWVRAGRGVEGRWVERKVLSHVVCGVSDLLVVRKAES